jgi:hypothetical protein
VLDDQLLLMPESSLPRSFQQLLAPCRGPDARAVGERLGRACRVLTRPGFAAASRLQELADALESDGTDSARWSAEAGALVGWEAPEQAAWPIGQAIEFAADFRDRYKTTGRLVQAIQQQSADSIETPRQLQPLAAGAPFAASHGLRYPIAQGPMTRVSDSAAFANAVSAAGALPFLALALMPGEQVLALLNETKSLVGERSWGVGLLGFVPKELRDKQGPNSRRAVSRPICTCPAPSCCACSSIRARAGSCSKGANAVGMSGRSAASCCGRRRSASCCRKSRAPTPARSMCCSPAASTTPARRPW